MNREDIIKMTREAWLGDGPEMPYVLRELERFAYLVAAAEREACIDLVAMYGGPVDLEAAIRARGKK